MRRDCPAASTIAATLGSLSDVLRGCGRRGFRSAGRPRPSRLDRRGGHRQLAGQALDHPVKAAASQRARAAGYTQHRDRAQAEPTAGGCRDRPACRSDQCHHQPASTADGTDVFAIDNRGGAQHPKLRAASSRHALQRLGHRPLRHAGSALRSTIFPPSRSARTRCDPAARSSRLSGTLGRRVSSKPTCTRAGRNGRSDTSPPRAMSTQRSTMVCGHGKGDDLDRRGQASGRQRRQGRQRSQGHRFIDLAVQAWMRSISSCSRPAASACRLQRPDAGDVEPNARTRHRLALPASRHRLPPTSSGSRRAPITLDSPVLRSCSTSSVESRRPF